MKSESPIYTAGIVADTHVPDRYNQVAPEILSLFKEKGVNSILHVGDISSPLVIDQLARLAPVYAVKGNRDWAFGDTLPLERELTLAGVTIGMSHGHGGWKKYLIGKLRYIRHGYHYEPMRDYLVSLFPRAQVIVYGHTHRPEKHFEDGRLLINPGAAFPCVFNDYHIQAGLLHIYADGSFEGEIISLSNNPPPRAR